MIPNYINEWIEIIENMNTTTTYKLAWGKAIIDCIKDNNYEEKEGFILITIDSLAYNVLRYYWNQEYFFHLKQAGPQAKNKSIILEEVIKLINIYEQIVCSKNPIWFDRAVLDIKKHNLPKFNQAIRRIGKNLIDNPCKYFVHIGNEKYYYVYNLNANKNMILIKKCDASCLNEYANILIQIINYKWSQLLEEYNNAPKINQKVARASERKIRRKNLSNFINAPTSSLVLFQFSVEKAYTVIYLIPSLFANLAILFKFSAPSLCPCGTSKLFFFAHLLLPSIIMAICSGKFSKFIILLISSSIKNPLYYTVIISFSFLSNMLSISAILLSVIF